MNVAEPVRALGAAMTALVADRESIRQELAALSGRMAEFRRSIDELRGESTVVRVEQGQALQALGKVVHELLQLRDEFAVQLARRERPVR